MQEKDTPLIRQYSQIKSKYPDTVLLFRMGDFFETFNDDAVVTAQVCGITLTKRNNGGANEMPLAGFPHHQLDSYLPKLVRAGHRVAVCEQVEDPKKARGIVKRDVIEVVTPGVSVYEKLLDSKSNNYVASVFLQSIKNINTIGFAACDISTGEFYISELSDDKILNVIESFAPAEVIFSKHQKNDIEEILSKLAYKPAITKLEPWIFDEQFAKEAIIAHFKTVNLKGFGIKEFSSGITAAGSIMHYINETQKGQLSQIQKISIYDPNEFMTLDFSTRRNLEITFSMTGQNQDGTLFSILDRTKTPMGSRLLKKWISRPLTKIKDINQRLSCVDSFFSDSFLDKYRELTNNINDLERIIAKICNGRANTRDVVALAKSLKIIPAIKEILNASNNENLIDYSNKLNPIVELVDLIYNSLLEEPAIPFGTGNIFKNGFSKELDSYVEAKSSGKTWISQYQETERQNTNISSLKVGFTSVFGYYIEVTNAHKNKVPDRYFRKQTLTNAERYTTAELKEIEEKILNAEEKITELEQSLFSELKMKIALFTDIIQKNAFIIASLDCLQSFAQVSIDNNYTKPCIDESDIINILEGRHPVVEKLLPIGNYFIPNSTNMNNSEEQIHIITGPNMSGKSCYLRQVGLIILLGQIGCFVPAKSAKFGIIDRIFTRVGAQDNITEGESTFLVEMQEAANILNNATKKSLVLLDEVGRGTATFDGISIAWAIAEYIHDIIGAKTLFATHYHELNELANRYARIVNYKVDVIETGGKIIFSHSVKPGAIDHSFGIHVAQMAGLPIEVVETANFIMKSLEASSQTTDGNNNSNLIPTKNTEIKKIEIKPKKRIPEQISIFEFIDDILRQKILNIDINSITPIDAFKILSDLQKEIK